MKTRLATSPRKRVRPSDAMQELYRSMLRIRMVEEKIAELYSEQEMRCPVHLSIGQEGVAVGMSSVLQREDCVLSGHRAHAHYLAKGGNLKAMLAEIYGKETGCARGHGGSMHLIDLAVNFLGSTPIVANSIPVAVGVAWAAKLQGKSHATVAFFGEAACEEGIWHESLNFAALHRLPIIFVCENNLYSVYTPLAQRQPKRRLTDLTAAQGVFSRRGDGNNVLEVRRLALSARDHVVAGNGPVFLEFETYRWREHCGPNFDNDLGYRSPGEFEAWKAKDPLQRMEIETVSKKKMQEEINQEIDEAVRFAKSSAPASEQDLHALIYG